MADATIPYSKERRRDGLTHYVHAGPERVAVGVHGDDPHGVNHEMSCAPGELVDGTGRGSDCRRLITTYFDDATLSAILAAYARALK